VRKPTNSSEKEKDEEHLEKQQEASHRTNNSLIAKMSSKQSMATASLEETCQKVKASLLPAIESTVTSKEFSKPDMLDFLDVKNSLMVSYMIDLTVYLRNRNDGTTSEKNIHRLAEMKTVLDKMSGLDKKLRYQIEKLLNASTSASTFASGGGSGPDDPLQFRPNPQSLAEDEGSVSHQSGESDDADDDLRAARATLSLAKERKSKRYENDDSGIYHAPRLAAVPYTHDLENKQKEKDKRAKRRLRSTELAQTLRSEYGDAPEQEDVHGGGDYGKQRVAAQRLAEREAEITRVEEDGMVRLITSRKDKKEKKRLMRMESSNLGAISDLSNLVRETREFGRGNDSDDSDAIPEPPLGGEEDERHHNGKRSRKADMFGDKPMKRRGKVGKPKNVLQSALYATEGNNNKKKSKR
jgi:U3 small nucleolar ribonucleoprotein protein LCP5